MLYLLFGLFALYVAFSLILDDFLAGLFCLLSCCVFLSGVVLVVLGVFHFLFHVDVAGAFP